MVKIVPEGDAVREESGYTAGIIHVSTTGARDFEYLGEPDKPPDAHREPGMFTLGDIGFVDDDGYLFLSDRKIDMIIAGGVNIYPAAVEGVLAEHPAVVDVAVFGAPNDEFGEEVKAAVQLAPGISWTDTVEVSLLAAARENSPATRSLAASTRSRPCRAAQPESSSSPSCGHPVGRPSIGRYDNRPTGGIRRSWWRPRGGVDADACDDRAVLASDTTPSFGFGDIVGQRSRGRAPRSASSLGLRGPNGPTGGAALTEFRAAAVFDGVEVRGVGRYVGGVDELGADHHLDQ